MATLHSYSFDTLFPLWYDQLITTGVLSLASIDFVRPDGMVLLFLGLVYVLQELPYIRLQVPIGHVRSYLARAGFFDALPSAVRVEPRLTNDELCKSSRFNGNCSSLLELTLAKTETELQTLLDRIVDAAERLLSYPSTAACDIGILVSEIWQNSIQHGDARYSPGVMQVYGEGPNRRLELAVGDDGIGIAKSLSENEKYKNLIDDCDAINTAVMPKVSRLVNDATRGNGLTRVVRQTAERNGIVCIRSGSARSRYQGEKNASWNNHVPHLPGTQVVVSLLAA